MAIARAKMVISTTTIIGLEAKIKERIMSIKNGNFIPASPCIISAKRNLNFTKSPN